MAYKRHGRRRSLAAHLWVCIDLPWLDWGYRRDRWFIPGRCSNLALARSAGAPALLGLRICHVYLHTGNDEDPATTWTGGRPAGTSHRYWGIGEEENVGRFPSTARPP